MSMRFGEREGQNSGLIRRVIFISVLFASVVQGYSQDTISELFRNSYELLHSMRNEKGIYLDFISLSDSGSNRASDANTGVGLVSLCIADAMGWQPDAAELAITTLKTLNGFDSEFIARRNPKGYFNHFFDATTGQTETTDGHSTIDHSILLAGAVICQKYFSYDSTIVALVDSLRYTTDFTEALGNDGGIYYNMLPDGDGKGDACCTRPFNEYMIVAWMALNDSLHNTSYATDFWNEWYETSVKHSKPEIDGIRVLSDQNSFISSFVHLFNYYYVNHYTTSPEYLQFMDNARRAEEAWWATVPEAEEYEWGCGAGSTPEGYNADKINNNPDTCVSPHIIAGFLPVYEEGAGDLLEMYRSGKGVYSLPANPTKKFLWKYSLSDPDWKATRVEGIDFSTMVFGLATLDRHLGSDFFSSLNDFARQDTLYDINKKMDARAFSFKSGGTVKDNSAYGWMDENDNILYKINIPETRNYRLILRYSSVEAASLQMSAGGETPTKVDFPSNDSYATFDNVSVEYFLEKGKNVFRIKILEGSVNLDSLNFVKTEPIQESQVVSIAAPARNTVLAADGNNTFVANASDSRDSYIAGNGPITEKPDLIIDRQVLR